MKNYDLELSVVLDDHGFRQALGLQAKTGRSKSKILKWYASGTTLINDDASPKAAEFLPTKWVRINFIGHGNPGATFVGDTGSVRTWDPAKLERGLHENVLWALSKYVGYKFKRLSMIVCYSGGHAYTTQFEYGGPHDPKDSFGFKFFDKARTRVVDMTARADVSSTEYSMKGSAADESLNKKVRFYESSGSVQVEWPYLGSS